MTGKSVILLPVGAGDDGAHSQNEKINIRNYIEGVMRLLLNLYWLCCFLTSNGHGLHFCNTICVSCHCHITVLKYPFIFSQPIPSFVLEFWNYVDPCIQTSIMLSHSELFIRLIAVLSHLGRRNRVLIT
jgi:hypothetical protein